jgi:hypothetical protein
MESWTIWLKTGVVANNGPVIFPAPYVPDII